jgi:hypothetical protein
VNEIAATASTREAFGGGFMLAPSGAPP